ncbi:beta-glucanase/beta-glucan synthetase [Virgibacillus proomii]|uniref:beta-glucanase/beta-glucan synthetase n=1 Tax=Virgibacillus proomii TaxID=84407 RepID=UPI001C0F88D7|nr:beta-glucanase/beta-glucan synthetase [Virgibacillus proomii]MBU5266707.1 beta-glucanase/beta-glucan synthetase [Virgibacillus proomii]
MQKSRVFRFTSFLIVVVLFSGGCSSKDMDNAESKDIVHQNQNPFELDEKDSVDLGNIGHGLVNPKLDENGKILPLSYDGGELKIDYNVEAAGKAKNVGFLIFVDGIPQPYKFNSSEAPYEYMHNFDLKEDNVNKTFSFIFTPVTGKRGDTLTVSITSVYNPAFIPDMKESSSYGNYHSTLESVFSLDFNKDADTLDASSIPQYEYISNVRQSAEPITKELMKTQEGFSTIDSEALEERVFSDLYIDDVNMAKRDNFQVKDSGTIHVTFKLFGHPGVKYRNTFYLNHKAITSKDGNSFETVLAKGEAAVIDLDIDLEKSEDFNTFYVVSVPVNAADFPDDVVVSEKTMSKLLYK